MAIDRDLIPFAGSKSVSKRLKELDREIVSIVVIIGIGFSKIFEGFVEVAIQLYSVELFGVNITMVFWWTVYTAFWIVLFLVEADKKAREGVEEVAETVDEITEE